MPGSIVSAAQPTRYASPAPAPGTLRYHQVMRVLRYLWAFFPNTLIGLTLAGLARATGGGWRVVDGVLEAHGGAAAWLLRHATLLPLGATAITFGHVVLGRTPAALDLTREHERVHVRQYERWGPCFLPAYGLSSLAAWRRGERPYRDNRFEREAFEWCDRPKPGCAGEDG